VMDFSFALKNGPMARIYTGDMCVREMLRTSIVSQRAGKVHYLSGETATYIGNGEGVKENNMGDKKKQMRTELHIWSID